MTPASTCTISYWRALAVAGSCALSFAKPVRAQDASIDIAVAAPDSADSRAGALARGLTLGTEEAQHTAQLFGVALRFLDAGGVAMDGSAARRIAIWIIAGDAARCAGLRATLRAIDATVVDAGCAVTDAPLPNEVRIHPPPEDSLAALASAGGDSTGRVLLWHQSLERFGADQLNERFRRRFAHDMDSDAWAAWAAVKIAVESCLRARARRTSPAAVLRDPAAVFDAHKGAPLRFVAESGRLVQPLYVERIVAGARTAREIAPPAREP